MPNPPDSLLRHSEELAAMRGELTPLERELLTLLKRLARLRVGPTQAKRAEWIDMVLELAGDARELVARAQAAEKPAG